MNTGLDPIFHLKNKNLFHLKIFYSLISHLKFFSTSYTIFKFLKILNRKLKAQ